VVAQVLFCEAVKSLTTRNSITQISAQIVFHTKGVARHDEMV
jgi:hypothetical protein